MRTAVMKRLGKAKEDQKGFTLIELLAVIVILAVIAAIAVPLIGGIINKSKKDSDISTARQIYDAARLYVTAEKGGDFKNTGATTNLSVPIVGAAGSETLQGKNYLDQNLVLPSTKAAITGGTVVFRQSDGALLYVSFTTEEGGATGLKYYKGSDVLASKSDVDPVSTAPSAP
ncbi:prepilin-type N-terminal cleavage/methylation domain-containing protein [Cohnella sp. OV330]|uniref:prepilin-type N-terminal cleavage/methylation domain-containing protein n=1 Tax=Cohnella sp. OV330 TaxID=1855288 RepID=UPI0008EB2F82|nr:type II secretion system protein [Cohnella sp. OV330]SFA94595.1 prepilin-type N-terminal cleavage/methylation domain-containing protein [Cohnella sp. OV330]